MQTSEKGDFTKFCLVLCFVIAAHRDKAKVGTWVIWGDGFWKNDEAQIGFGWNRPDPSHFQVVGLFKPVVL